MNNEELMAALATAHETAVDQNKLNAELARLAGIVRAKNVPLWARERMDVWVTPDGAWDVHAPNFIGSMDRALTLIADDPAPALWPHPDRDGLCWVRTSAGDTSHAKIEIAICMAFVKAKIKAQAYGGGE